MIGTPRPGGIPHGRGLQLLVLSAAAVLVLASGPRAARVPDVPGLIGGALAWLLASSTDLGPARTGHPQLTAVLHDPTRPEALIGWASSHGLSVQWRPGDDWAYIEGAPANVASAFGVAVHDYRSRSGQVFYASAQQPSVPAPVRGEVTALGRILGYRPHPHVAKPANLPLDVPKGALTPDQLLTTYNASPLSAAGLGGQGINVVLFEGLHTDGYTQEELDTFATTMGLPKFTPQVLPPGAKPGPKVEGEATMDLEVVHAIAPFAHLVVIDADSMQGSLFAAITNMFELADRQVPGAVWSSSIGFGCDTDSKFTAADLAPVRQALATAETHGTSALDASGDTAGFDCKASNGDWDTPPGPSDRGLDVFASLPEMTDVGGTSVSTDDNGTWLAEETWIDSPMTQGTGGGVSHLFDRPPWQTVSSPEDATKRLTPDVAADADPTTGMKIYCSCNPPPGWSAGGGTSQSAPIWAGLTALMDQYLLAHGGHALGALNPLLYQVNAHGALPAFHDVAAGGNGIYNAGTGFDLTTGLGTPDTDNLVHDLLDIQRAGG